MFSSQSFLQIEERELLPVLERHDLAIENYFGVEAARVICQFGKLIGHPPQIARKYFRPTGTAMKLCADAVELVFHVDRGRAGKTFPDRLGGRFRTRQHALDWPKQRK